MALPAKAVRAQLKFFKPFIAGCSLETSRKAQDKIGELMEVIHKRDLIIKDHDFGEFKGAWVLPKDELRSGVVLYLHGGGYTCGDIEYAKGFAATLADECGVRVFCCAYRLAPENPFPAAVEDALKAYEYLIEKGYNPRKIVLCGESAGGGLIYALCLKLKELNKPLPCGLIGISPWTDLTMSGESFIKNRDIDPSMTKELLEFYASCYTAEPMNPLCSPLYGDLKGLPPSILFVGGDEVMLDDTRKLHEKLIESSCESSMFVGEGLWHGYLLYHLNENKEDFERINAFFNKHMARPRKLRWMKLDNAAKIFPASKRKNWNNVFRLSVSLYEDVDEKLLARALDVTVRRFPSIAVRLRRGMFWYYLEEIPKAPEIQSEKAYPLEHMPFDDIRKCAFRVIVYKKRIAVEFFHALTDGNGGLIFLKTLLAEYLSSKYGISVPNTDGVLGRLEKPKNSEIEDSYLRYAGDVSMSRKEATAYRLAGTAEPDGYKNLCCFILDSSELYAAAKKHGVSVTAFLCAVMTRAILNIEEKQVRNRLKRKPVKINVPVNLRTAFESKTLRNFVSYVNTEIDGSLGDYNFEEICQIVQSQLKIGTNDKILKAKFSANVASERSAILRVMPLFIKNIAMKAVFDAVGECKSCLCMSNLGVQKLPDVISEYVERMDFIIGVQAHAPYNCGVITWNGKAYINFIRDIKEPLLEYEFFKTLQSLGLHAAVESNQR